jgi:hypothetical protein
MAVCLPTRRFAAAIPAIVAGVLTGAASMPLRAQTEPVQSPSWTQEPGSNRFGVGLNGLGGTHATPMYASPTDLTGWGITDMKTRTPAAPTPVDAMPGEQQARAPESGGNDLGGLLPPLDQR